MKKLPIALGVVIFPWVAAAGLRAAPVQHDFIAIDEGLSNLFHVNEADPSKDWLVHIGRGPSAARPAAWKAAASS